jgi:23S rRNA (adenine2503-C2)-methyltransferase
MVSQAKSTVNHPTPTTRHLLSPRKDIKDLTAEALIQWLDQHGEPSYRSRQIQKWLYVRQVDDFTDMTDLSKGLRLRLAEAFVSRRLSMAAVESSDDGSRKYLFRLHDGAFIESVLMPEAARSTLCISSQVGCAQGCRFCLTAKGGFIRNLSAGEIIAQVRDVMADAPEPRLTNIVVMGMGEPLANYGNLIAAIRMITDADVGLGISKRRFTVSTAGLAPRMDDLGRDADVNLAVSLNAADDATRSDLMPINRTYPLDTLMAACRRYPLSRRRRITFEYILMAGVNDADKDAYNLSRRLHGIRSKINLIPFNAYPDSPFQRPARHRVAAFQDILAERHHTAMVRISRGQDISAACGQLRANALPRD